MIQNQNKMKSKPIVSYNDFHEADFGQWTIGNREMDARLNQNPSLQKYQKSAKTYTDINQCPYCSSNLLNVFDERPFGMDPASNISNHLVRSCDCCGWWFYDYVLWGYLDEIYSWTYYEGVLKAFNVASLDLPISTLKNHLAKNFDDIRNIHPRKFEELCQAIFREHLDCEVRLTAYSKDGGIDLYAFNGDQQYAIQLKRRMGPVTESVKAVREFIGAMVVHGAFNGIYCTTADHFSQDAVNESKSPFVRESGICLELVDYGQLLSMFDINKKYLEDPWKKLLRKNNFNS